MDIVVPMTKRMAEMEAIAKQNATATDVQAAKADFIAMMCDVDLSMIEDDETEANEDGTQQDV